MRKIEKGTIARTVVLVVALINQVLMMAGYNPLPFADEAVYEAVTVVLTVGASLVAWWKNNSFTQAAIAADETLKQIKGGNR
ncbi:MAG: phage holin [Enterocloster asparagiformis]|nr:phage holin [Enterocloster asparagiformis]